MKLIFNLCQTITPKFLQFPSSLNLEGLDLRGHSLKALLGTQYILALFYVGQPFFLDVFSASRPSEFAKTLSFLLEFLSFFA